MQFSVIGTQQPKQTVKEKVRVSIRWKRKFLRSLVEDGIYQDEQLNKRADELTNYEEVIPIVKEYKKVIQS